MKIHIPAFEPWAKCNEHLKHGPIDIDLGEDVVMVVRCKECRFWSNEANGLGDERVCRRISVKGLVSNYTIPEGFCSCGERKEIDD